MCNYATISHDYQGLGLVASGHRTIRSGAEYNRYFDLGKVQGKEITLVERGNIFDTISRMKKIVADTLPETKRISKVLQGSSREETARKIWSFLYNNVQYKIDHPEREQLRTPLRTWNDRKKGVDCDCYSIFISSVLTNLGIPHAFRIAKYSGDFQHVYVIVPKTGTNYASYFTIDPVVERFNYEVPTTETKDYTMKTTMLNGFGACRSTTESDRPIIYVLPDQLTKNNLVATTEVLKDTSLQYKTIVDENNNPAVIVKTEQGNEVKLPTVVSAEQATQIKAAAEVSQSTQESLKPSQASLIPSKGGSVALGVTAFAGLLYWAFSPEDKPGKKLSGPPKKVAQKKMRSMNI